MVMPMVISEPAPSPWSIRKAINCSMLWAMPDRADPARKISRPVR
jgi:hypothetical protein